LLLLPFFLVEFPFLAHRQPSGQRGPVQRPRFGLHVSVVVLFELHREDDNDENKNTKKKRKEKRH
jgi:hypothetical protein